VEVERWGRGWKEKEMPAIVRGIRVELRGTVGLSRLYLPIVDKVRGREAKPVPELGRL
jgi:hypothetical protein